MLVLSKLTYRFQTNSLRIPADYFVKTDKLNLKFICKCEEPRIEKKLKKKINFGQLALLFLISTTK